MKFFLISDNRDTFVGMRLAGAEGVIVASAEEARAELDRAVARKDIGIVMLTEALADSLARHISDLQASRDRPLITALPDRHGSRRDPEHITKYLKEAIGIKLD